MNNRINFLFVLLLLLSFKCAAQYPFEKYPSPKYHKIIFKHIQSSNHDTLKLICKYGDYKLQLRNDTINYSTLLRLYLKNRIIKEVALDVDSYFANDTVEVADIDHNGFPDFKFIVYNNGSGLAGSLVSKIFLFNHGRDKFKVISFMDFSENKERDLNGDGDFEIIGQSYLSYKNHAYWVFDLYNYKNGKLVNVSHKFNYPILTRFLYSRYDYAITNKISRKTMKRFSVKLPRRYSGN